METLFIRFLNTESGVSYSPDDSVQWILSSQTVSDGNCGNIKLANVHELVQDRNVVILLPVEHVYISTVDLQTRNKKQLMKAVPFALEEELAEDIESMHFAFGERTDSGLLPVTAINKQNLDDLLEVLNDVDLIPHVITPDIFGIETQANKWVICADQQRALVRTSQWSGFSCESMFLDEFVKLALNEEETAPQQILVYQHPDEDVMKLSLLSASAGTEIKSADHWSPTLFASGYDANQCINLLQGSYAKKDKTHITYRPWKIAAALGAIWLTLSFGTATIELWSLKSEELALDQEIEKVMRQTFPDIQNVVNARVQMEQRLKELGNLSQANDGNDFLKTLSITGTEIKRRKNIQVSTIDFSKQRMQLELQSSDIQQIEQMKQALAQRNLVAEIVSADTGGKGVNAKLSIQE